LGAGAETDEKEGEVVGRPLSTLLDSSSISACPLVSRPEAAPARLLLLLLLLQGGRVHGWVGLGLTVATDGYRYSCGRAWWDVPE